MALLFRYGILLTILFCGCKIAFAQPFPQLTFNHLTKKDGLSDNQVTCITEDKNGFIWFSTINGLNRFDGYRMKQFFHADNDSSSIAGNNISQIAADEKNNLWIATQTGLSYFNINQQKAFNFAKDFINKPTIASSQPANIFCEKNNHALITSGEILYEFDSNLHYQKINERVENFTFNTNKVTSFNALAEDKKNNLWSFSINRIFLLDAKTKKILKTFKGPDDINVYRIFFDSDNQCWLTTRASGLFLFSPQNNQWKSINTGSKGLSGCVAEWKINNKKYIVYISESNEGLVFLDVQTLAFQRYKNDAFANPMLSDNGVGYVFTDKNNILWVGTQNGISYVTPSSQLFNIIPVGTTQKMPDFSKRKIVFDIYEDQNGYWLSKWYLGGIFHYSKSWEFDKYFSALYPHKSSEPNLTSMSFNTKWYKGKMYMTTDSGLVEMDTNSLNTKIFQPGNAAYGTTLRTIITINDTLWWIQSYYNGIYVYDAVKKKFIKHYQYNNDCKNCMPDKINEIFKSSETNIYLCSNNGLFEYQKSSDSFINYKRNAKESISFPGDSLYGITEDKERKLWIGTNKGLCVFNQQTKKIEKKFTENNLTGSINALCTDSLNNIWMATSTGPWCRLSANGRFINFINNDMPENSGDGVLATLGDGKVYDGCLDAIIQFNPEWLKEYAGFSTKSVITEISAGNKSLTLYKDEKKIAEVDCGIHLFTVDFSLVNYNFIEGNKYFYRLLPLSNSWQQNANGHISFYDIPPGKYTLEVKGYNEFDRIFSEPDSLIIDVKFFWWQTWWFKLLCAIVAAAIIFLLVKRRIANIRKEAAILQQQSSFKQKIAETEMQALRAQMNPHFIFNSLNSIENFMMKNDKRMASDYFSKFASLIRMILDSSRNELVPFAKDIETLKLYVELEQLRFDNKFSYQTIIDPELHNEDYSVPPLLIQPFVENAIIHGLSQSDKEDLRLLVTVIIDDGYIIYTIQDNGIGRKQSALYKQANHLYKSMGMEITQQRINVFNQQQHASGEVTITDLHDEFGEPDGTKVQVKLKAI